MKKPVVKSSEIRSVEEEWGSLTWVASGQIGNTDNITLGRVVIKKGYSNPPHCHSGCEEVLYLLRGRLEHTLGDEVFTVEAGDVITLPPGVYHAARSVGDEDAEMIVVYNSATRDFQPQPEAE